MVPTCIIFSLVASCALVKGTLINNCPKITTINRNLKDMNCDQPLFVNVLPKTEDSMLLDNICLTFFPLPDDPSTFQHIASMVYCDGSNEVRSSVGTDISQGVHRGANPFMTFTASVFGYAGCDTYLSSVCANFLPKAHSVYGALQQIIGLSSNCAPLGLSCLRKIEEIIDDHCLPDQEFYVLPMKLPNRCVTMRQCFIKENNPFHKTLGLTGPINYY